MSRIWNAVTATKNALGNVLFLLIIGAIAATVFFSDALQVPERGALILNPKGVLVEQRRLVDPLAEVLGTGGASETRLRDVLEALDMAVGDPRITHVVLDLEKLRGGSIAALLEVGNALDEVRASGKPVYAFAPSYTQAQYLLAAHADKVYLDARGLDPLGPVFLSGLGVFPMFYRSALDRFHVRVHVFRAGLYKSAVEPWERDDMSATTRAETETWLGTLWKVYSERIADRRGLERAALGTYSDTYPALLKAVEDPNDVALDAGLVDSVLTPDEWNDHLTQTVGGPLQSGNSISMDDYLSATRAPLPVVAEPGAGRIAVLTLAGMILDGRQPPGTIGSDSVLQLIERARQDESVHALVVRVDTPGGSASAAEDVRVGLESLQNAGKPVVVSMSGTAASGGYWLASTANRIFASEATLTGSIGTFITFPTINESLAALGINRDGVGTTPLAGGLDPLRGLNPMLAEALEASVGHTYLRFTSLVARGRNLDSASVEALAQGRVFTGSTALDVGLIDALGGLDDAVASAAQLAGVSDYHVIHLERELSARDRLLRELSRVSLSLGLATSETARDTAATLGSTFGHLAADAGMLARLAGSAANATGPALYAQCLSCNVRL